MLKIGDCLLIETNPNNYGHIQYHLFIIVLTYQKEITYGIIVPVQTLRSRKHDQTTVLNSGCHEFIKKDSYINYHKAKINSIDYLQQLVDNGIARVKSPLNEKILQIVREGILNSQHTPMEVKDLYLDHLFENL